MRTSALSANCTVKSFGITWSGGWVVAADWMDVCDGCWRRCFRCRALASLLSAPLAEATREVAAMFQCACLCWTV